jgi:predicted DNA-binding protein (MmcQ/YjbR family)
MTWAELLAYCLKKPGAWQDEPWEGDVVVKVGSKIFAFLGSEPRNGEPRNGDPSDGRPGVGVKCGPDRDVADEWIQRYPDDAKASAYIGRSGWNTLSVGGAIPDDEIREAIDDSYEQVVAKLPKRERP